MLCGHVVFADWSIFNPLSHKMLKMKPGDLKRFSGHALTLLRTKCPNIKSSTIFELNRFIGKAIAEKDAPVSENDPTFLDVIESVTTCSSSATPLPKTEIFTGDVDLSKFIFFPTDLESVGKEIKTEVEDAEGNDDDELLPFPVVTMFQVDEDDEEPPIDLGRTIETNSPPAPAQAQPAPAIKIQAYPPPRFPKDEPAVTIRRHNSAFVTWVNSVMRAVNDFFGGIFGSRHRRSSGDEPTVVSTTTTAAVPKGRMHGTLIPTQTTTSGQAAFRTLFDEVCRIYCNKCAGPSIHPFEFKMAAQKLLEHIFDIIPSQGIELAATHHLTSDFIKSVEECG